MKPTASNIVYVNQFTNGLLDPTQPMLGPVRNGGFIVAQTAPGCWGPMITPAIRGSHEVTQPVYVDGADVGDAIAIRIVSIQVTSLVTSSGSEEIIEGRYVEDPYCIARCDACGAVCPVTYLDGIGAEAVRCTRCGAEASPFRFEHGYTMAFDDANQLGVTLSESGAVRAARDGRSLMRIPDQSQQHPIVTFAPHHLTGVVARMRPFLGQLGTTPSVVIPDSHNAGDFGASLVGASHTYALTPDELATARTDGHLDVNRVREGAVLICPVKVVGGGVYLGDMHAMQGDGEIAGHTTDVSGLVTLQVTVLKGLQLDGPVLLPVTEDLPYLAKPFTAAEKAAALKHARTWGVEAVEDSAPICVIGTGVSLNAATDNGLERAARLLGMTVSEVRNRATITGAIQIGRHPGVVTVTFLVPTGTLQRMGLLDIVQVQYKLGKESSL